MAQHGTELSGERKLFHCTKEDKGKTGLRNHLLSQNRGAKVIQKFIKMFDKLPETFRPLP